MFKKLKWWRHRKASVEYKNKNTNNAKNLQPKSESDDDTIHRKESTCEETKSNYEHLQSKDKDLHHQIIRFKLFPIVNKYF
jgi:SMC interacting uncharacterized protein involved in chromosome segregation